MIIIMEKLDKKVEELNKDLSQLEKIIEKMEDENKLLKLMIRKKELILEKLKVSRKFN